jgi:hypothetical protein
MVRIPIVVLLASSLFATVPAHAEGDLFVTLPAAEFSGGLRTSFIFGGGGSAYCDGVCEMVTSAALPNGSRLVGIEIDGCRDAAGDADLNFYLLRRYANDQRVAGDPFEILAQGTLGGTTGCNYALGTTDQTKVLDINTFASEYLVVVTIGDLTCASCPDVGTRFQALRVYYRANLTGGPVEPTRPTGSPTLFP